MYISLQECIFSWKHAKKCRATLFKRGCVSVLGRVQLPGSQGLFIMEQSRACGVSVHKLQQGLPGFECPSAHSLAGAKCTSVPPLLPRPRSPSSGAEPLGHTRFSTRGGCSSSAASGLCSPAAGTTCSGLSITTAVPRNARSHPGSLLINSCHPTEHPSQPRVSGRSRAAVVAKSPFPNVARGLSSCFSHGSAAATPQPEILPPVHSASHLPSSFSLTCLLWLHPACSQPLSVCTGSPGMFGHSWDILLPYFTPLLDSMHPLSRILISILNKQVFNVLVLCVDASSVKKYWCPVKLAQGFGNAFKCNYTMKQSPSYLASKTFIK